MNIDMNIDMNESELTEVLKKEIETLKTRNTILYRKKKNVLRSNLRLKKQLKNQIIYIISLKKTHLIPITQKYNPILKTIQEEDEIEDNILLETFEDEWDYL